MATTLRPTILSRRPKTANPKPLWTLLLVVFLAWSCCGSGPGFITVFCSPDFPRMQEAVQGLKEGLAGLPLEVTCAPQFGKEAGEALQRVRQHPPRLLVALGTPALMLVAPVVKQTPVVFALVANPYFTGAAYEAEHPEMHQENLTGIASPPPLTAAFQQGVGLLGKGAWGLLYDPNDGVAVEIAARFTREAPRFGLTPLVEASDAAATDTAALARLMARGARVIYLPPAPGAARYASQLLDWGKKLKVLVVSSWSEGSSQGAILWVGLDYRKLGEEAAALVRRVLSGEPPARIPIAASTPIKIEVDERLLRHWSGYPPGRSESFVR